MLIVGKQVRNERNRSYLIAVNNNGNLLLIEIQRDMSSAFESLMNFLKRIMRRKILMRNSVSY